MIVPRSSLLFWTALIVLPFTFLAAASPRAAGVSLLFIGALLLVALFDAIRARKNLAGVVVELPPVTRMSKDRGAKLELRIRNQQQQKRLLRVGLPWPREIKAAPEELDAVLPAQSEWSRLPWPCTTPWPLLAGACMCGPWAMHPMPRVPWAFR